jgi:mannose-6-phosphate isomerase-like protein (cupin superfamily)
MHKVMALLVVLVVQTASTSTPATYKTAADLAAGVAKTLSERDTGLGEANVASGDHYGINLVKRTKPGSALAHPRGTEVHYITDGSATLVTGGTIARPTGGGSAVIEHGVSRHVSKGDVIFIPAGTPHWYSQVNGSVTYLETRFEVEGK